MAHPAVLLRVGLYAVTRSISSARETVGRRRFDFTKLDFIVCTQNVATKFLDLNESCIWSDIAVKESNLRSNERVDFCSCDSRSRKQCDTPLSARKSNPGEPMGSKRHLLVQRRPDRQWGY